MGRADSHCRHPTSLDHGLCKDRDVSEHVPDLTSLSSTSSVVTSLLHQFLYNDLYGHIRQPIVHADFATPKSADQQNVFCFDT